jgi:hypothetical protein
MKFFGKVGYGHSVDNQNGVWEDVITEKKYYGDVVRNFSATRDRPGSQQ